MKNNNQKYPKVSFLSIFYNNKATLKRVMDDMLQQDYPNIEHVIVDGGSNDGTIDLLKEYELKYRGKLLWVSEPDKGIFDAVKKAHKLATGDYIMEGTDYFVNISVISTIVNKMQNGGYDICHSGLEYIRDSKVIRRMNGKNGKLRLGWMPATPTICKTRFVYEQTGEINDSYISSGDYEYTVRMLKDKKYKIGSIPETLILFEAGGISNGGIKANLLGLKEGHRALKENGIKFAWLTDFCRCIRTLWQYRFIVIGRKIKS